MLTFDEARHLKYVHDNSDGYIQEAVREVEIELEAVVVAAASADGYLSVSYTYPDAIQNHALYSQISDAVLAMCTSTGFSAVVVGDTITLDWSGGEVVPPPIVMYFEDTFNRANVSPIDNGWVYDGATASIVDNQLFKDADSGFTMVRRNIDNLPADYYVEWDVPHATTAQAFTGYAGRLSSNGTTGVQLFFQNGRDACYAGHGTIVWNLSNSAITVTGGFPATWTQDMMHSVGLLFAGTTVTIYFDNQEYGHFTATTNSTLQNSGIATTGNNWGTPRYFDAVRVTPEI